MTNITCIITPNSEVIFAKIIKAIAKVTAIVSAVSIDMYCDMGVNRPLLQALVNSFGLQSNVQFKDLKSYKIGNNEEEHYELQIISNIDFKIEFLLTFFNKSIPILLVYSKHYPLLPLVQHGENGCIIYEDDETDLVQKLTLLLTNKTFLTQLSRNAYQSWLILQKFFNYNLEHQYDTTMTNASGLHKKGLTVILNDNLNTIKQIWQYNHTNNLRLQDKLILSLCNGLSRAKVLTIDVNFTALGWSELIASICNAVDQYNSSSAYTVKWLRLEWVSGSKPLKLIELKEDLKRRFKRNYFRSGIAIPHRNKEEWLLCTEMELNANACLYGDSDVKHAIFNESNFIHYLNNKYNQPIWSDLTDETEIQLFNTVGVFIDLQADKLFTLANQPREWGKRDIGELNSDNINEYIFKSSRFLAEQIQDNGQYIYGYFPCFDKRIDTYNVLRHASSTYSLIESYEFTKQNKPDDNKYLAYLKQQITHSLIYLQDNHVQHYGKDKAYVIDINNEIKLGANAAFILAIVKFAQVFNNDIFIPLAMQLAVGIEALQQKDGRFFHVLNAKDLTLKDPYRIIYYEGEASFALIRLYGWTKNERWLNSAERALNYYIKTYDHAHDHWMSYTANEIVKYRPRKEYFVYGVRNITGYVDYIKNRQTTFPTLLELSMAFHNMLLTLQSYPQFYDVIADFDLSAFYDALHTRANYLLNGFFYPEIAMFYKSPKTIVNGFFIRHHAFRVRIDDIEHYLSGLIAYQKLLQNNKYPKFDTNNKVSHKVIIAPIPVIKANTSTIAWGGDVNLGRRQHFLTDRYGLHNVMDVSVLRDADYRIVNLECVISSKGEQGIDKNEGGSYYFRARPDMVKILNAANIDLVCCANNHSGDYGKQALLQQMEILRSADIDFVGIGSNENLAFKPIDIILPNGVKVAIFNIDATTPQFSANHLEAGNAYIDIKNHSRWTNIYSLIFSLHKKLGKLIIVTIHWGANNINHPCDDEIEIGHRLIDAGADTVLGASAHRLQGVELYKNKPIIHDAGNLLFDVKDLNSNIDGAIFHLNIDDKGIYAVRAYPLKIGYGKTTLLKPIDAIKVSHYLAKLSSRMKTLSNVLEDGSLLINIPLNNNNDELLLHGSTTIEASSNVKNNSQITHPYIDKAEKESHIVVNEVPDDAKIEPIKFGSIKLIGVRTQPHHFNKRRILWVESYWTCESIPKEDYRIQFRAKPLFNAVRMKPWGNNSAHDPCDWLMPTTLWQSGKIYRDFYGLRPPYFSTWENGKLQLEVIVIAKEQSFSFKQLPFYCLLNHPLVKYPKKLPSYLKYKQGFHDDVYKEPLSGTWNARQLEVITDGKWINRPDDDWYVDSLVVGKKHIEQLQGNVLFVANSNLDRSNHEGSSKKKKTFDHHDQLPELQNEVCGAIVSKTVTNLDKSFPMLKVKDPIKAWIEIGIAARSRFSKPVIAVTGTVGKTSTCNMLKTMLGENNVLSSVDNYNTRVGVLGTLANLSPHHKAAVIEVAQSALWMNRGPVTKLLQPNVALITEIGLTQTSVIKSLEHATEVKCKIFDGLSGDAIAVIGAHLPNLNQVISYAKYHAKKIFIYGDHPQSEIRIKRITTSYLQTEVQLETDMGLFKLSIPLPSEGMAMSAIAAFCIAYVLKADLDQAIRNIEHYHGAKGRMQVIKKSVKDGSITLIDDSFNATYHSMTNAFNFIGSQPKKNNTRLIYVLGRIVNLADKTEEIHRSLAAPLLTNCPDLVITHGDEMCYLRQELPDHILGDHFNDAVSLSEYIKGLWENDDVILLKGSSRNSDFSDLVQLLVN